MGSPVIFSGAEAKLLNSGGIIAKDGQRIWPQSLEINVVPNPSATTGVAGVTNGTSHATAKESGANSPLDTVVPTAFKVTATATAAESATSGSYQTLTIPTGLRNKKLKVEFYFTTEAAQTWALSLRNSSGRLSMSTDLSSVTTLPAGTTGKFTTYVDTDSDSGNYTLHFTRTAGAGTAILYVTNIILGPGIQASSAAVGEWQSFTPALVAASGTPAIGTGGSADAKAKWRRVGSNMVLQWAWRWGTTAPVFGTGAYSFALPSGYSVDASALITNGNVDAVVGTGFIYDSDLADFYPLSIVYINSSSNIRAYISNSLSGQNLSSTTPFTVAASDYISVEFTVPIAEWAGSGTVNLGAGADVEYAYNNGASTGADDSTAFGYGPQGGQFVSVSASHDKTVRFQTPIQPTDRIVLEVSTDSGVTWIPLPSSVSGVVGISYQGTLSYGMGFYKKNATDILVSFGLYRALSATATYAAAGQTWAGVAGSSVYKWRVVKSKAGQAVGFGAATQNSLGLVKAGQVPGTNTNDSAVAGYIGEYLISSRLRSASLSLSSATETNVLSTALILTAGEWDVGGSISFNGNSSTNISLIQAAISKTSATNPGADTLSVPTNGEVRIFKINSGVIGSNDESIVLPNTRLQISSTTSMYLVVRASFTVSSLVTYGSLWARRVR